MLVWCQFFYSFIKDIAVNAELLVANSLTLVPKCCLVDVVAERQKFDLGERLLPLAPCTWELKKINKYKKSSPSVKSLTLKRGFSHLRHGNQK